MEFDVEVMLCFSDKTWALGIVQVPEDIWMDRNAERVTAIAYKKNWDKTVYFISVHDWFE